MALLLQIDRLHDVWREEKLDRPVDQDTNLPLPSRQFRKINSPATSATPAALRSVRICSAQKAGSIRRRLSDARPRTRLPVNRNENSSVAVRPIEQRYFWPRLRPREWQTVPLEGMACRFYYR